MPRRLMILCLTLVATLLPTSLATASDTSVTHAYLKASYTVFKTSIANITKVNSNVDQLNSKLAGECPNLGAGAPQNEDAQKFSYEAFGALEATAYSTDAKVLDPYVKAVSGLHWGSARVNRALHSYLQGLHELLQLRVPDLCSDVRAWKASSFLSVPSSTSSFDRRVESIEGKPLSMRLLSPYESASDRALGKRLHSLEVKLEHLETLRGQDWWNLILQTVGLPQ